jgi:type I restriction enzyme S subunit
MSIRIDATFDELYRRINAKDKQILATEIREQGDLPVVDQGKAHIAGYTNNLSKRYTPPPGGVIIFGDHTRIVKFADFDFAIGADGTQLIAARGENDTEFLAFLLAAQEIPNTGYNRHFKFLKEMTFSVPPLHEQQAIAAALSDADGVVAGLERVIAKKRLIKQGAMQDLLTARRRLPGFSGEWELKKLGAALTVRHGRSQKEVEHPSGEFPILATGGQIGTATKFLWDRPSVLIGRKGTIDVPRFMDTPFWSVDTLFYTDVHAGNDAKFLFYVFLMVDWMSYNEASGVPSLNAKTIENIEVRLPKLDEQQAIAAVLSDMDAEIQTLESHLAKARAVKEGMMQNLLTGRVRLV